MSASKVYLVHGPPGTGKTTYLSEQAGHAVDKHGPNGVAIASLTRTAAHEIASRTTLHDEAVGTLHAHCYRGLNRPDLAETPGQLRDWSEKHPQYRLTGGTQDQLEDTPIDSDRGGENAGDRLHNQVTNHRARLTPIDHWTPEQRQYHQAWCVWKDGRMDFTDLIEQAIREMPAHPLAPRVLLLDEAQDFSALELKLATTWAAATETTVIAGDMDQSIFSWRGADPRAFRDLDLAGERILAQSHRVPREIHALADRWIRRIEDRQPIEYRPTEHAGLVRGLPMTCKTPDELLDVISGLDGQVMVLATCGYMLGPLIAELRENGVPFHNPYREKAGNWNPLRSASRLAAFLRAETRVWGDRARAWTWDDLRLWTEPLQAKGVLARGAKTAIEATCQEDRFGQSRASDEVPLETLMTLLDAKTLHHPAFRGDIGWWERSLRASQAAKHRYPLQIVRRQGGQALLETPKLMIGTVHSFKGGECDHAIVIPDLSRTGMWMGWQPGGPGRDQIVRMGYVAATRARQTLSILEPSSPERMPLRDELPQAALA